MNAETAHDGNGLAAEQLPEAGTAVQGVFDFATGNANGYVNWRRERDRRAQTIRREWQIPVGRRVRLSLRNVDGSFEGRLELAQEPVKIDRHEALALRLDKVTFTDRDIESCVVIDDH